MTMTNHMCYFCMFVCMCEMITSSSKCCYIENLAQKVWKDPQSPLSFTVGQPWALVGYRKTCITVCKSFLGEGQGLVQGHFSTTDVCHLQCWNHLIHYPSSPIAILFNLNRWLLTSNLGDTAHDINQDQPLLIAATRLDLREVNEIQVGKLSLIMNCFVTPRLYLSWHTSCLVIQ